MSSLPVVELRLSTCEESKGTLTSFYWAGVQVAAYNNGYKSMKFLLPTPVYFPVASIDRACLAVAKLAGLVSLTDIATNGGVFPAELFTSVRSACLSDDKIACRPAGKI